MPKNLLDIKVTFVEFRENPITGRISLKAVHKLLGQTSYYLILYTDETFIFLMITEDGNPQNYVYAWFDKVLNRLRVSDLMLCYRLYSSNGYSSVSSEVNLVLT